MRDSADDDVRCARAGAACSRLAAAWSLVAGAATFGAEFDVRTDDVAAVFFVVSRVAGRELTGLAAADFAARATGGFAAVFAATGFFATDFFATFFGAAFFGAAFFALRFVVADLAGDLRAGDFAFLDPTFFLPALGLISMPSSGDRWRGHDAGASG